MLAGFLDDSEVVGGDRTQAIVILVVGGTAVVIDEGTLDGLRYAGRHVVVETFLHANGHGEGLIVAEMMATVLVWLQVVGTDAGKNAHGGIDTLADLPAEALGVAGATVVEAAEILLGLLAK